MRVRAVRRRGRRRRRGWWWWFDLGGSGGGVGEGFEAVEEGEEEGARKRLSEGEFVGFVVVGVADLFDGSCSAGFFEEVEEEEERLGSGAGGKLRAYFPFLVVYPLLLTKDDEVWVLG